MKNPIYFLRYKFRNLRFKLGARPIKSSYPFISGDSYRLTCEIDASSNEQLAKISNATTSVFITPDRLQGLVDHLDSNELAPTGAYLVVHNGDEIPNFATLDYLCNKFGRIYCVNWLGNHPKIEPIPIGLENVRFLRNGIPSDFNRIILKKQIDFRDRPVELLVAFSLHTNPEQRGLALSAARRVPGVKILDGSIYPYEYLELVSQSKYVLSPPGNGPDCHRTWESLYLGAIPIVHESAWPFKDINMPVAVISSWDEISNVVKADQTTNRFSPEELHELFMPRFGDTAE